MNRSITEKARALIIDSKLDKSMWGEAVLTATYLLNRSPTTAENGMENDLIYQNCMFLEPKCTQKYWDH
jgi:hypothetical protein